MGHEVEWVHLSSTNCEWMQRNEFKTIPQIFLKKTGRQDKYIGGCDALLDHLRRD